MKPYTKTGDKGTTGLIGGQRVSKCHPQVEAYGTLDELDAFIGLLKCKTDATDSAFLLNIQQLLTRINCLMACGSNSNTSSFALPPTCTDLLEAEIDRINASLPPITEFLIPGSCETNALCNVCRTLCRRAERCMCALSLDTEQQQALIYINRLSDYLFVLGRKYDNKNTHFA